MSVKKGKFMLSRHGKLESAILSVLWSLEKDNIYNNTVKDVYNHLSLSEENKRAYTTIKTVMDRLSEKKILLRYKENNKFFYKTAYSRDEIIEKIALETIERYCDNNPSIVKNVVKDIEINED